MLERLKIISRELKLNLRIYQLALKDSRTPKLAKFLLWLAVGYVLIPFDLIPDFIPVIGHLDDAVIVPFLILLALKLIPREVIINCREKVGLA
ncbi:MAG: DUF1232 domain-containing protein [Candidatus Omnitrophica bacterium]|nr:DUF1232 domain-containing protein [Candidatus Omnitrophota bacterium]